MAKYNAEKQCSDAAQTGTGVTTGSGGSLPVPDRVVAPSISPSGNNPSGSSQGQKRDKQG